MVDGEGGGGMNREPVAIAAAVRAVILAGVAFGLEWTGEQVAALMLAVEALLALVVRQQVTPTASTENSERGVSSLEAVLVVLVIVVIVLLLVGPLDINTR